MALDGSRTTDVIKRLLAKSAWQATDRSAEIGDCLVWTGFRNEFNYGMVTYQGKSRLAHRVAWNERHGALTAEAPHVLHTCDNPPCFLDSHLFAGTHAINMADRDAKGRNGYSSRTHCPHNHPYDEHNTYRAPNGQRQCRACGRERMRATRKARRLARLA